MSQELARQGDNGKLGPVMIENARIIFRNFEGREGQYNQEGDRNFGVVLPPDVAQKMADLGWNIKYLKPREEDEAPTPWISVSVSYRRRPPRVVMITHRYDRALGEMVPARTALPEDLIGMLDYADLSTVDIKLNPYSWAHSGRSGVKAYLQSIFAWVARDELEEKYAHIEEVDINGSPVLEIADHMHGEGEDEEMILEAEYVDELDES